MSRFGDAYLESYKDIHGGTMTMVNKQFIAEEFDEEGAARRIDAWERRHRIVTVAEKLFVENPERYDEPHEYLHKARDFAVAIDEFFAAEKTNTTRTTTP